MKSYRIHYPHNTACILAESIDQALKMSSKWGNALSIKGLDTNEVWPKPYDHDSNWRNYGFDKKVLVYLENLADKSMGSPVYQSELRNNPFGSIAGNSICQMLGF